MNNNDENNEIMNQLFDDIFLTTYVLGKILQQHSNHQNILNKNQNCHAGPTLETHSDQVLIQQRFELLKVVKEYCNVGYQFDDINSDFQITQLNYDNIIECWQNLNIAELKIRNSNTNPILIQKYKLFLEKNQQNLN